MCGMKYIIENRELTYMVDWDKLSKPEGGIVMEYHPTPKESIEVFLSLLENIYPKETIADVLAEGLDAMDYSPKGIAARRRLEGGLADNEIL